MKDASFYRTEGRAILKDNWGVSVIACLIVSLITGAVAMVPHIGALLSLLITGPLVIGLLYYFINLRNTKKADLNNVFDGFKNNLGNNIITYFLVGLFTALWSLLFVIPGLIKSFSYAMTMFIRTKQPEITATDAITLSRKIMDGKKFRYFCLSLSFIGWIFLSIFTLGIGLFFVIPYMQASSLAFFEDAYNEYMGNEDIIYSSKNNETDSAPSNTATQYNTDKNTLVELENDSNTGE